MSAGARDGRKLIFLDIDGTLTLPGRNVPPESALQAVRDAQKKGHGVFLCTGRNRGMTAPLLRYGFDGAVCSAGGCIFLHDEILYDHPISNRDRDDLLSALRDSGVFSILEARDSAFADGDFRDLLAQAGPGNSELERWRAAVQDELGVLPMSAYRGEPVYKVTFTCFERHQVDRAREQLQDRFVCRIHDLFPSIVNGEFISLAFDKGRAMLRLCEHLGVPRENTVGFGDSMNDLEMVETAGIGVAMGNASAELKEHADLVCPPVGEDGLAAAFTQLGLV